VASAGQPFNILLRAVSSIDGNQQWQAIGLPYPVSSGKAKGWPKLSRYGRPGDAGSHSGFLLWGDPRARGIVFKQLFKGPLNPGLETHPAMVGNYPFPSCERNPFPSTTRPDGSRADDDYTCRLMSGGQEDRGDYPALSERVVKPRELAQLGLWELRVARNEIFARYGYRFGPDELKRHFMAQTWYAASDASPRAIVEKLSPTEWSNIVRIQRREEQLRRTGVRERRKA
jgi:hypothetical protein